LSLALSKSHVVEEKVLLQPHTKRQMLLSNLDEVLPRWKN